LRRREARGEETSTAHPPFSFRLLGIAISQEAVSQTAGHCPVAGGFLELAIESECHEHSGSSGDSPVARHWSVHFLEGKMVSSFFFISTLLLLWLLFHVVSDWRSGIPQALPPFVKTQPQKWRDSKPSARYTSLAFWKALIQSSTRNAMKPDSRKLLLFGRNLPACVLDEVNSRMTASGCIYT
jgi:hypothetical protein